MVPPRRPARYAEYVTAPSRQFARKPATVDHAQAAAVPLAALTAWQALVDAARCRSRASGSWSTPPPGGVGHFAVQFAKHLGAHVIGTAGAAKHAWLRRARRRRAHRLHRRTVRGRRQRRRRRHRPRRRRARRHQHPLAERAAPRRPDRRRSRPASPPSCCGAARARGLRATAFLVEPDGAALTRIAELIDDGTVRVEVEEVFPLDQAAEAHRPRRDGPYPRQARPAGRPLTRGPREGRPFSRSGRRPPSTR